MVKVVYYVGAFLLPEVCVHIIPEKGARHGRSHRLRQECNERRPVTKSHQRKV